MSRPQCVRTQYVLRGPFPQVVYWYIGPTTSLHDLKYIHKLLGTLLSWWWKPMQTIATSLRVLTHWGRVTHICIGKLTIIGSDNGLPPDRRQAIIRTNAGISLIGTLGTNFSEILSKIYTFAFNKMHLKMSSRRWQPFCLGLCVLTKCMVRDISISKLFSNYSDSHYKDKTVMSLCVTRASVDWIDCMKFFFYLDIQSQQPTVFHLF